MAGWNNGCRERGNARAKVRRETGEAKSFAALAADSRPSPNAYARRLKSMGYQVQRHMGARDGWHAFETDKGIVAITRHPGGRWEVRRQKAA